MRHDERDVVSTAQMSSAAGAWKTAITITDRHQQLFSRLSGDVNDEHIREGVGQSPLVFGGLTALWLCGEALTHIPLRRGRCEVIFVSPIGLDAPYTIVTTATALQVRATLRAEHHDAVILTLRATREGGDEPERHVADGPISTSVSGDYRTDRGAMAALCKMVDVLTRVPPDFVATMALASYVLGMRLPALGRFAGCECSFDVDRQVSAGIDYSADVRLVAGRRATVTLITSAGHVVLHLRRRDQTASS